MNNIIDKIQSSNNIVLLCHNNSDGDAIANGTYIYKVLIKSEDGNYSKSTTGKLAKLK